MGYYSSGQPNYVGGIGYYWSSGANMQYRNIAYRLDFSSGGVSVNGGYRDYGFRVEPLFE